MTSLTKRLTQSTPWAQFLALAHALDPTNLCKVIVTPFEARFTYYLVDERGNRFCWPGTREPATRTDVHAFDRDAA